MIKGFKDFISRGSLIEAAVGLVMALAVYALTHALVDDLVTPIVAAIFSKPSFGDLSFTINDSRFRYGDFINALITFASVGAAMYFFVVVPYQRYQAARGVTPETKKCPECLSTIPIAAGRCSSCGQSVPAAA